MRVGGRAKVIRRQVGGKRSEGVESNETEPIPIDNPLFMQIFSIV